VEKQCNKLEIKGAIEEKFNVKIKKVATMNFKGKNKNMTIKSNGHVLRTRGNRSSWKKAIVTLEEGFSIDLLGGEA
jgi:large subunit ribosomal protein L23